VIPIRGPTPTKNAVSVYVLFRTSGDSGNGDYFTTSGFGLYEPNNVRYNVSILSENQQVLQSKLVIGVSENLCFGSLTSGTTYGIRVRPVGSTQFFATSTQATTSTARLGPAPVILGSAGNYVILAKSGISTTGTTTVVGDIGLSPAATTYLTGFSEDLDA
jgi:hypothetical protein